MNPRTEKFLKLLRAALIVGSALAAVKVIFVDYTLDEEYQVVMAYRNLSGDSLFGTMWEPHQTSAFLCVWLMRLFTAVTGTTTGVVIFLRVCTTFIQLFLSLWLYRISSRAVRREYAFLIGAIYFNIVPKIIQIPEFSNLQVWAFTVALFSLAEYYALPPVAGGRPRLRARLLWLAAAGGGMASAVLAYPASLLLFPFFLIYICLRSKKEAGNLRAGLADGALFGLTCAGCAAVWLGCVLSRVPLEDFIRNVRYAVTFDATHDLSLGAEYRAEALFRDAGTLLILLAVMIALALALRLLFGAARKDGGLRASKARGAELAVCAVLAAGIVQLWYWLVIRAGYEIPQLHLLVLPVAAVFLWKDADDGRKWLPGVLAGLLIILSVVYMSDLGLWYAIPHGLPGIPFALLVILGALEKKSGGREKFWAYLLLFSMAFLSVFGKGFVVRAGMMETNTVLGVRGIIRKGPAAGVFTNYIQAYITNVTYDEFQEYVEPGSNCLIVTNLNGTAGTSPYMFSGAKVCHFSIVDPTTYDERLLDYWELYPEKRPEVIVVDCWYGELKESPDSWIMRYIEEDFGYSRSVDGKYVRYYFR